MIVYISGPITGITNYHERFQTAEDHLQKLGHKTINPADIGYALRQLLPAEPTYETYLAVDLALLEGADAIYMLKGYDESNGARVERLRAAQRGKRMFYQGDSDSEAELAGMAG